jgi:molybdopterin biosynthesis enzyme MoaB
MKTKVSNASNVSIASRQISVIRHPSLIIHLNPRTFEPFNHEKIMKTKVSIVSSVSITSRQISVIRYSSLIIHLNP